MLARRRKLHLVPDLLTAAGLMLAPFVLPWIGLSADTMNRILVLGIFGLGFDLLFGYTGLLSFGQSAFYGTGGFVAAYLLTQTHLRNVFLGLAVGTIGAAVVGFFVGLIALRRTGIYFAMITVAIAEVFFFVENSPLSKFTGGENGLPGVPAPVVELGFTTIRVTPGWSMYGFLSVCFFVSIFLARRVVRSPVGHLLVAIRENPQRVAAVGNFVSRYKLLVFVIAAAYSGFAGGLLGVLQGYMPPDAFTFETSGELVMQTVIGGAGTLLGPLVGAAVWLYLRDLLQGTFGLGATWKLILGLVFVILVSFLRRGIIGGLGELVHLGRRESAPVEPESVEGQFLDDHVAGEPIVDVGASALVRTEPSARSMQPSPGTSDPILVAKGVSKRYGGLVANDNIDFTLSRGELRGVIGPNGAGKSTFFKMLACEVEPSTGHIFFEGREITGVGVTRACQLGLSKSYQVNQLFARLSVRENLTVAALSRLRGPFRMDLLRSTDHVPGLKERVQETLGLVRLHRRADVRVSELAYGEKRRLEIGIALATVPTLLLLDEPLAGMSPRERTETVSLLRTIGKGRTLVVIDHDMDAIFELAGKITVLAEGRILTEGTPDEVRADPRVQSSYLGGVSV